MFILSLISLICLFLAIILHILNYYDVLVKINVKLYSLGFNLIAFCLAIFFIISFILHFKALL